MRTIGDIGNNNGFLGTISSSSIRSLLPRSRRRHNSSSSKLFDSFDTENAHPNIHISDPPLSPSTPKFLPTKSVPTINEAAASDDHCEMAHPQVKEDMSRNSKELATSDPPVKVVVRIRPASDDERARDESVRKVSWDTLSIRDRKFTFDGVLDSSSNQEDIFQQVGIPLVKSALAGYNASILSYGQTGSGKTYTLWGPPSSMLEKPSSTSHQGIVPRIFQMLFNEIHKEEQEHDDDSQRKQINYQCRCSFLEIYNEQINDLLDPVQRKLEIRDDPKNGMYVENLSEEYVSSCEDVTQILIKGLSNRKVGATSINSKSSRSHVVFTLVLESWCKGASAKCFSSSKISRINLVDLAGMDRNAADDDDDARQLVREGKHVKKSLSQLGKLVSMLARGTGEKSEDMPYNSSCLTHLLQESLGGNAKLTVICNIPSDTRNDGETLRTLRFGQRVKAIKNDPVINEISEDDVNNLSDQIRQLKEELIRAKSNVRNTSTNRYFNEQNVRESLNHLSVSLNRSLMLPNRDNDDNEVDVDENDVKELHQHLDKLCGSSENSMADNRDSVHFTSVNQSFETGLMSEDEVTGPDDSETINSLKQEESVEFQDDFSSDFKTSRTIDAAIQEPILSESPKISKTRKSLVANLSFLSSQTNVSKSSIKSEELKAQALPSLHSSSEALSNPTDSLAASLHRGLQIIDYHHHNSTLDRSSVSFSFEHLTLKPSPEVERGLALQELEKEMSSSDKGSANMLCASCQQKLNESSVEDGNSSQPMTLVAKDGDKSLREARKREQELEKACLKQAVKIKQLNQLIEQYKHGRESSLHLEGMHGQMVLVEEAKNEKLKDQDKLLSLKESNQPEFDKEKTCETKEISEALDDENSYSDDMMEKEALLREIQNLRTQLQLHTGTSAKKSTDKLRSSLLARSIQLQKSVDARPSSDEELELEKQRWTEMESEWISLTDDLRIDLESSRRNAEKVEMELILEKKCNEELDDALNRAVLGHARMVEHYAELQENHNELVGKHRAIMEGIAEVKKAALKAGSKGRARFARSLAAELSALRVERERERDLLKKENKSLRIQLRDTAEAVQAAGELLVRLREAEQAASTAEENFTNAQTENDKLKKQIEKLKRKHKMEMITMKQYLAESRLPESALKPLYPRDSEVAQSTIPDDDEAWRAEFGAIYQDHY
ncbi:hypothetical protein K2173_015337 [Erythroxylum novogranatense]|uniref:Kinesin motor domain-containing protein n=1 Tax=Erythroxylum novogranatense TaxID=1862640 RepID=A0AAV8SRG8_9ROSI|nr:hypothetical protein K2173_015337 [Erythroxylum novogranatense]